jgi:hypothetical protein
MDTDLLNVLFHSFIGNSAEGLEAQSSFVTEIFDLTEQFLDLLESTAPLVL